MGRYDGLITGRKTRLPKPETIGAFCPVYDEQERQTIGMREDTPDVIRVIVKGAPIAKPRMSQRDKWKLRPCVVRYREWADRLREIIGPIPPAETVDEVSGVAYFEPPKSWSKKRRLEMIGQRHVATPDADNLAKAVLDALWKEDSGIFLGPWRKFWNTSARLEIEIRLREGGWS